MEGILVPLILAAMIVALVVGPKYLRARSRDRLMETLQTAYEKGQPVPPELVESLTQEAAPIAYRLTPQERAYRDLRAGIITLAVALAFVALGWGMSFEEDEALYIFTGIAAFPGFIGLALIAFGLIGRNAKTPLV